MSDMQIQPYLFFNGRCQEALEFYTVTLGAQVEMMMKDSPESAPEGMLPQGFEEKVMQYLSHRQFDAHGFGWMLGRTEL